jgi:hypothetical protein
MNPRFSSVAAGSTAAVRVPIEADVFELEWVEAL